MILRKLSFEYNGYTFILRTRYNVITYVVRKDDKEAPISEAVFNKYHKLHAYKYHNERA